MKSKATRQFKIFYFLLVFGISVFLSGYFYLNNLLNITSVAKNEEKIPYYSVPENTTILFKICNDNLLIDLDFNESIINVLLVDESFSTNTDLYGYSVDYTVKSDYDLVSFLVDNVGGIELENDGELLRYTGVQICEMFEYSKVSNDKKNEIIKKIIDGIAVTGLTKEDMLFIIEESETNLNFSIAYLWVDHIKELCKFPRFIN